jgi:predicted Ser/Thr protein kinase
VDDRSTLHKKLVREAARRALFGGEPEPIAVGRYELRGRIGEGAMGVVYAAYDPRLDRKIALKLVRSELAEDAELRERMTREARALARLTHPNVVTVFDVGMEGERLFIAMELVDGETLGEWVRSVEPSAARILEVVSSAGRGLAAAHAAGLVHRDFKPGNVLVTESGLAKVVDFGLARAGDAHAGERVEGRLTEPNAVVGTPAYMAPEQLRGEGADARSDQYALAVTLYEALHGSLPFRGATANEVIAEKLAGRIVTPTRRRVPRSVEQAIARAMSVDPARRFPNVRAFVSALAQRRTGRWLFFAAPALFVATAAAVALVLAAIDPPERERAVAPIAPAPIAPVPIVPMLPRDAGAPAIDAGARDAAGRAAARDAGSRRRRDAGPAAAIVASTEELDLGPFVRDVARRCWRYYQEAHPGARGVAVTLTLRVAPSGEVTHVSAESMSDVPDLLSCIETRGRDWQGFERSDRERRGSRGLLLRPESE